MYTTTYQPCVSYLERRAVFICLLKEFFVGHNRISEEREFQMSGPVCRIDLWARAVLGFSKWIFEEVRVG